MAGARRAVLAADAAFAAVFISFGRPAELLEYVQALSAAAGLRLGIGLFYTGGMRRLDSVRDNASRAVPIMAAAAMLFVLAAFTEGFLSPSPAPYVYKAFWAILCSGLISFYFVILGFPDQQKSHLRELDPSEDWDAA